MKTSLRMQSSAPSEQVKEKQEAEIKGEQKADVTSEQEAGVDKPPHAERVCRHFLLRPRTFPWSILLCSKAGRIGQGQEPWST